jgi:hypothetical protein
MAVTSDLIDRREPLLFVKQQYIYCEEHDPGKMNVYSPVGEFLYTLKTK